jgi:hypothetical protein
MSIFIRLSSEKVLIMSTLRLKKYFRKMNNTINPKTSKKIFLMGDLSSIFSIFKVNNLTL